MFERRHAPRLFLGIPATLYTGAAEVRCETHDISRLGVAVMGNIETLPTDTVLRVVLSLTDASPRVACDCMVAHQRQGGSPLIGLKFVDPPPDLLARLRGRASVAPGAAGESERPPAVEVKPPAADRQADATSDQSPRPGRSLREERDRDLKDLYEEAVKSLE